MREFVENTLNKFNEIIKKTNNNKKKLLNNCLRKCGKYVNLNYVFLLRPIIHNAKNITIQADITKKPL